MYYLDLQSNLSVKLAYEHSGLKSDKQCLPLKYSTVLESTSTSQLYSPWGNILVTFHQCSRLYELQQLLRFAMLYYTAKHTYTAVVWRYGYSERLNHNTSVVQHLWLKELRGEAWQYSSSLMCFLNGILLGNEKDLAGWAKNQWSFSFTRPQAFYMALTEDYYTKHLRNTGASQHHSHINNKYRYNKKM